MRNRRLILLLAALLVLAYIGWRLLSPQSGPPATLRTDGPLTLSFQSVVRNTNQLSAQQLQGRAAMLSLCNQIKDTGVAHDRFFLLTNGGHKTIRIYAYNPSLPLYRTEIKTNDNWALIPTVWSSSGGVIMLKSGQSLSFPALTPNASTYRLGVTYEEVDIPVTDLDNVINRTLRFLFPKKRWDGTWFLAYSDEIRK
ncbi:MAG TPA: hypothetical protein VFC07_15310 [Verrucomicrobiae bacterium]|nr:hypothetical protein [Verrucomicrobiae bacterium]